MEFKNIAARISGRTDYQAMKQYRHHLKGNTYRHSLKVAYLCYLHYKKHGGKDLMKLIRGALLHDFYLYDCHARPRPHRFHLLRHPRIALRNAQAAFPELDATERDIILHHMFPLTPIPPRTREGWIVCIYDKIAAISDLIDG